jgi:hypothetical protein
MNESKKLIIEYCDNPDPMHFYFRYSNQFDPQQVRTYLSLETGKLWTETDMELGNSTPEPIWNNRVLAWTYPCVPTPNQVNNFMSSISIMAQDILDGSKIKWNQHNYTGHLTPDAAVAEDCVWQSIIGITSELEEDQINERI